MVRHLLQGGLGQADGVVRRLSGPLRGPLAALRRLLVLCLRWLAAWLLRLVGDARVRVQVGLRIATLMVRPADPNNLFTAGGGTYHMAEAGRTLALDQVAGGERRPTLLFTAADVAAAPVAVSLKGAAEPDRARIKAETDRVNRRFSHLELLATELRRVQPEQILELHAVINRLARQWLNPDEQFEPRERRSRLDVRRTLRCNIPRYGGYVLNFKWDTPERPVPRFVKPARILAIGDVSHSMYHYAAVTLYFLHMLNFVFQVDSYVFSEQATRSTPYLNGPGTFTEKVRDLIQHARSWNAGTRLGSSLRQVAAEAQIDPYTYVIIATDGKVTLTHGEYELIHQYLGWIKRRARMVVFLTPEAAFARNHGARIRVEPVGTFRSGIDTIPIFDLGQIWYHTLGRYADRVYLVRTVQDLISTCEDLYHAARG